MTKTVFDNHSVAHVWASQSQAQGRSGNGNFYFEGKTLFSYGPHFPVGYFFTDKKGRQTVLINASAYTVSTRRHVSLARSAVSHLSTISIPELQQLLSIMETTDGKFKEKIASEYITKNIAKEIAEIEDKKSRMRSAWRISNAESEIANLKAVANFVWQDICGKRSDALAAALKVTKAEKKRADIAKFERNVHSIQRALDLDISAHIAGYEELTKEGRYSRAFEHDGVFRSWLEHISFDIQQQSRNAIDHWSNVAAFTEKVARKLVGVKRADDVKAMQERRDSHIAPLLAFYEAQSAEFQRRVQISNADKIEKWRAGEPVAYPHNAPMCLRIVGDELQTSQGARVPLADAINLTKSAIACRITGKAWRRNGEIKPVGHFQTDRITERGDLIVGCHNIPFAAIADCVARHAEILPSEIVSRIAANGDAQ